MKITLCGSAKFEKQFKEWNKRLTLGGNVVYSLACYPSDNNNNKNWYTEKQKDMLDLMHKEKILNSDAIFVINANDYIGDSTKSEITFARLRSKQVIWAYRYNGKCSYDKPEDKFITCPYEGCAGNPLIAKPPCPICYE